jgi:hypothetical protein
MFSNRVIGIFSQFPILYFNLAPTSYAYVANYDAHTVLFLNSETLVTNNPQNSAILDSSTNNISVSAVNASQGSFSPFDPFEKGARFTGETNSFLNIPSNTIFQLGSGAFTVECWFNRFGSGSDSNFETLIDFRTTNNQISAFAIGTKSNGAICTVSIPTNTGNTERGLYNVQGWNHLAVVNTGTVFKLFINGTQLSAGDIARGATNYTQGAIRIGACNDLVPNKATFNGIISDLRVVKGQALYTTTFKPPTTSLSLTANGGAVPSTDPLSSNVSLLTLQKENEFTDSSTNNFTLSNVGVSLYPLNPYASSIATTIYSSSANGGSIYFNGASNSFLNIPSNSLFQFGTGAFTAECWFYRTGSGTSSTTIETLLDFRTTDNTVSAFTIGTKSTGQIVTIGLSGGTAATDRGSYNSFRWNHLAVVNTGTAFKLFLNGTQLGSDIAIGSTNYTQGAVRIGTANAGVVNRCTFNGYMSDVRITKGQALYTSNFTPPSGMLSLTANGGATPSTDPLSSNVSLLLNGTNAEILDASCKNNITVGGSVRLETNSPIDHIIYDQSPNNFSSTNTNVAITTNSNFAVSGFAGYFPGANNASRLDATSTPSLSFGASAFTAECWFYRLGNGSIGTFEALWDFRNSNTATTQFVIGTDSSNQIRTYGLPTGAGETVRGTFVPNAWNHLAVVNDGTNFIIYVNGAQTASVAKGATNYTEFRPRLGANVLGQATFNGYISNFRVVKGQALYTSNFTPPTAILNLTANGGATPSIAPLSSNVSLLTLQDKTFKDNSTNNLSLTSTNAVIASVGPFYSNDNISTYGGSMQFNASLPATLDYAQSSALTLGSSSFTVECWFQRVYANNTSNQTVVETLLDFRTTDTIVSAFTIGTKSTNELVTYGLPASAGGVARGSFVPNAWNHLAVVNDNTNFLIYLNGTRTASAAKGTTNYTQGSLRIGAANGGVTSGRYTFNGYVSDVRVVKGQALYTSNFTPPTASLSLTSNGGATPSIDPLSSNVSLLLNNFTSTLTSDNKSINFEQTGYLLAPNINELFNFGTGDFTLEFNLFLDNIPGSIRTIVDQRTANASESRMLIQINASNKLEYIFNGAVVFTSTNVIPYKKWTKISIFRKHGTIGLAVNDSIDTGTLSPDSNTYSSPTQGTRIGGAVNNTNYFYNYVDDFKIINGASKFESPYSIPSSFDYLLVAGGGGSGGGSTSVTYSGGGAGGLLSGANISVQTSYTYTIAIGAGGTASTNGVDDATNGVNSTVILPSGTTTTIGGARGVRSNSGGANGGSGSGAAGSASPGGSGTAGQGLSGGGGATGSNGGYSGGGGGAGQAGWKGGGGIAGEVGTANGGDGLMWLDGNYYAGGGAGLGYQLIFNNGAGGLGGGGDATDKGPGPTVRTNSPTNPGQANTGGGAGGGYTSQPGSAGGSGVCIIRTLKNSKIAKTTGSPTVTTDATYRFYKFTGSGTFTFN